MEYYWFPPSFPNNRCKDILFFDFKSLQLLNSISFNGIICFHLNRSSNNRREPIVFGNCLYSIKESLLYFNPPPVTTTTESPMCQFSQKFSTEFHVPKTNKTERRISTLFRWRRGMWVSLLQVGSPEKKCRKRVVPSL